MAVEHALRARSASHVPFLDLSRIHAGLKDEILADVGALIDSGAFSNGRQVTAFENAYASYIGTGHCVAVASGLDALRLALLAAGIESGDEVVVPAMTFVATAEAVSQAGGRPVVVDVSDRDYNIDVNAVEAAITERTRFLLPVHLYGQMADLAALQELADRHGLLVIEDACQAHGATRDGLRAGGAALGGAFSFYPGKNLGAFGDAGAVTTDSESIASTVRALREHGQRRKYHHVLDGYTSRLDTIHAVVLLHKLPLLDAWNEERRVVAQFFNEAFAGVGDLRLPPVPAGSRPVWHLYVVRTAQRAGLAAYLAERGIATGLHYPEPIHLAPAYAWLGYERGACPVAEALSDELLSLPIFPGIVESELETIAGAVADFFSGD